VPYGNACRHDDANTPRKIAEYLGRPAWTFFEIPSRSRIVSSLTASTCRIYAASRTNWNAIFNSGSAFPRSHAVLSVPMEEAEFGRGGKSFFHDTYSSN
jgi:hypothetical protein